MIFVLFFRRMSMAVDGRLTCPRRQSLFNAWLGGLFMVAPFVDVLMQFVVPLLEPQIKRFESFQALVKSQRQLEKILEGPYIAIRPYINPL